jgi:hypothetical protein
MKHIFILAAFLFHIVCNAEYIITIPSQPSWDAILSDSNVKIDRQDNNSTYTVYVPNPITFSTQHRSFHHHTPAPRYNLNRMNTEQLIWYFSALQYTEEQVLSYPLLYTRATYLALVKQLSRYPEFVKKYYQQYKNYSWLRELWEVANFRYCWGLKEQFATLHQECEKQRLAKEARDRKNREEHATKEQEAQAKNKAEVREAYTRELVRVENILTDGYSCKKMPINNHKARLETIKIAQQRPERKLCQLRTEQDTLDFAAYYGITELQITQVTMNSYECQLHTEFFSHIHSAVGLQKKYVLDGQNIFIDALGQGIALGMKSNHLHNPEWATQWSDFCYEATEIIRGIGEGIVLGSYNTVDMVMHPVRTLARIADGVRMLGSLTARTVGTLARWNCLIERGEYLQCATEVHEIGEQLTNMAAAIYKHTSHMSNREIAKHVTAFGTEWVLTGQMFAMGHTLCSNLGNAVRRMIKFLKDEGAAGEFALATTDGVLFKASENINKSGGSQGFP